LHQGSNGFVSSAPSASTPYSSMASHNGASMQSAQILKKSLASSAGVFAQSPADAGSLSNHTGSPIDDESDAQKLFDRWCNTMGGDAHGQFWDPVLAQWPANGVPHSTETFSAFTPQPFVLEDASGPSEIEAVGDSAFWEALVTQIREGGVRTEG